MRTGIILILAGVFFVLSGLFLSTGYNPSFGILASLPHMNIGVTADTKRAVFSRTPELPPGPRPVVSLERPKTTVTVRLSRAMEEHEIVKVLDALDIQYPDGPNAPNFFLFEGWTVTKPGIQLPFALVLVIATAFILIGCGLIILVRRSSTRDRVSSK